VGEGHATYENEVIPGIAIDGAACPDPNITGAEAGV
jgi:hypothetical protein